MNHETQPGDFFVMLQTQGGGYTPLMDDDDDIAKFQTLVEAVECAQGNPLGAHFGFEVFERGNGEVIR